MTDPDLERLGLESASSAYRRRRCSGSVNLINRLRQAGKLSAMSEPDPDAASGTLVHRAWCLWGTPSQEAEQITEHLNPMQTETLTALNRLERLVVADWAGGQQCTLLGREIRLWLHEGLEPIHSGQYDVAYGTVSTGRMLILDAKTLFEEVTPAESNDQLRELVALARFNFRGCVEFTVGILQPWVTGRPILARFDQTDAELALRLLRHTIDDCADPDAPRTPGAWCKHCPALGQCEEAQQRMVATHGLAKGIDSGQFALPIGLRGTECLDLLAHAEMVIKALRAKYKDLLRTEPDAVPGWYLKPGNKVREITDPIKAWYAVEGRIGLLDFLMGAELKIGTLEGLLGKERFMELFAPVLDYKQQAPKLTRVSAAKTKELEDRAA